MKKTLVLVKTKDDVVKAYWNKIGFIFKYNFSKENILFLENYVWIYSFERIKVENLKKENLTTKISLEDLSLDDLNNESCILIPRNNLLCIKLNLRDMYKIFENEINVRNFKSLSLKTKIIIEISTIKELVELNKLKEYIPEHSELAIYFSNTNKILKYWINNIKTKFASYFFMVY